LRVPVKVTGLFTAPGTGLVMLTRVWTRMLITGDLASPTLAPYAVCYSGRTTSVYWPAASVCTLAAAV